MNEKTLEKMMEYALVHGLDDMCVRLEFSLVIGPDRMRIFALEGDPEILEASFKDMAAKYAQAKAGLQAVLDDQNKVATTQAPVKVKPVGKS